MSRAFAEKTAHELKGVATQLAWRQWRAVGGSATAKEPWHTIVDPEALILASLLLVDREPRIEDVMLSWVEANAPLLSVQRLKNLQRAYPPEVRGRVASFAQRAKSLARHPRWSALSKAPEHAVRPHLPDVRRATRAPTATAATLLLRLRLAMGVGVKADVLSMLLGKRRGVSVRELADNLDYTAVGVRTAVADLSRAGFIMDAGGSPLTFSAPRTHWRLLLGLRSEAKWVPWHHWFAFTLDYIVWCDKARQSKLGDYAIDVKVRELISRHDIFYRYASPTVGAKAFQEGAGAYTKAIEILIDWPSLQERRAATTD